MLLCTPIPCHLRDSRLRKLCRLGRWPASRARLGCEIGGPMRPLLHGTLSRSLGHYMPTLTITVDALMCATRGPARMRMRHARRVTGDGSGGNHKGRKQHRRRLSDESATCSERSSNSVARTTGGDRVPRALHVQQLQPWPKAKATRVLAPPPTPRRSRRFLCPPPSPYHLRDVSPQRATRNAAVSDSCACVGRVAQWAGTPVDPSSIIC